jgi:ubiquinone/menaquinone biosynthesis C-methylase UbiE
MIVLALRKYINTGIESRNYRYKWGIYKMNNVNYDKISEIYDAVRSGDPEVIAYILENKVLGHDSRILEIGCGSGNNTILMAAATEAEVHGLDQSKGMFGKAENKSKNIRFIQGDAVTLKLLKTAVSIM